MEEKMLRRLRICMIFLLGFVVLYAAGPVNA